MTGEPRRELGRVERLAAEYDDRNDNFGACESDASACVSWRNADGVWLRTVTASRSSKVRKASGSRLIA